jgi:hypothetical protein
MDMQCCPFTEGRCYEIEILRPRPTVEMLDCSQGGPVPEPGSPIVADKPDDCVTPPIAPVIFIESRGYLTIEGGKGKLTGVDDAGSRTSPNVFLNLLTQPCRYVFTSVTESVNNSRSYLTEG